MSNDCHMVNFRERIFSHLALTTKYNIATLMRLGHDSHSALNDDKDENKKCILFIHSLVIFGFGVIKFYYTLIKRLTKLHI